jgi:serine/threonine protein kinase
MLDPSTTSLVGSELGRFRVMRHIGAGGMGVVYEALNVERNLTVALKTLDRLEPDAIYRLKIEFRSLADVTHPNLVKMHELACVGGRWFFVMDYVAGVPFVEYVRSLREPKKEGDIYTRLRRSLGQLASGLSHLHALGKIHRDIKPPNVLVTPEGRVVILDFGLSTDAQPAIERSAQDAFAGTPLYMAPEIFIGEVPGAASDWYAVGVMLYEALVGLSTSGARELMSRKLTGAVTAPVSLVPSTPGDLNDLCVRLLDRDPDMRPSGSEIEELFPPVSRDGLPPPSQPLPHRGPFIGRKNELSALRIAHERVSAGRTVVVSVSGESGIGKSALVEAFLRDVQKEGDVVVLSGRCYERESVPYKAFDQIVDALSHYLNSFDDTEAALVMPRDPSALATLFPVLARVPVVQAQSARPLPSDPAEQRLRGFAAFAELLRRVGDRRRLVLAIDDLQWSDADSALLLTEVFGEREPPSCLLIVTSRLARPQALRGLLSNVERAGGAGAEWLELHLGGLSLEEASHLAQQCGLGDPQASGPVRLVTTEAMGNPFFVIALARNAAQTERADASLQSFMRHWVGSLPRRASELLQVIAVAGRPVEETAVTAVVGGGDTSRDLALLATQHFISGWPTPSRLIECYHDQIRESVIGGLAEEELCSLHGRLAGALESTGEADAQDLALHFLAAGNGAKGSLYAERAADEARRALAFLDAARWYERALSGAAADVERTRHLQTRLGEAFAGAGRGRSASQWFLDAARGAPLGVALKLRQRAAELLLVSGHIDEGVGVLEEVLSHIHMRLAPTPQRALASLLWQRARARMRGLRFVEREAARLSESELLKIDASWSVAVGLSLVDTVRAADFQTRNLLLALDGGEPYRVARALAMEAGFRATGGSRSEKDAKELSKLALDLAERVGHPHAVGLAAFTAGLGQYLVGRWRATRDLMSRAEDLLVGQPGAIWELSAAQRFLLNSLVFLGDIPTVAERVPELVKRARERGNLYAECYLRVRLCSLLSLAKDDPDAGVAETIEGMQLWSQEGFHLQHYNELYARLSCALYQGRAEEAMQRVNATWPKLERTLLMRTQALRVEARHLRNRVCLSYLRHVGRDPYVQRVLASDIRELRAERVPWASAYASFAQGLYYAVLGDMGAADASLSVAHRELEELDMHLFAAATRWRRGQLAGGQAGRDVIAATRSWLTLQQIKDPERFVDHYAPGL